MKKIIYCWNFWRVG